jgi:hypothetical protein
LAAAQDGQFIEIQGWEPDEKTPEPTKAPRVLIAPPAEKQSPGLRLF